MKICFVTTNFPRYLGDSEGTFVWEAVRAVVQQGHDARVIAQHWPSLPTRSWMEGVEVIRPRYWWPESGEILRQQGGGLPIAWNKSWRARLQMIPFIIVHTLAIARYAPSCDVVHTHWSLSAGAAWLGRIIHRRPILATLQGSDIFQVTRNRLGAWITRFVLQRCDHVSVLSRALAQATAGVGISQSAITIIPNGVDLIQFIPPTKSRQPLITYVGALIKRKGIIYLLEAMSKIGPIHPSYRLIIVGDGPERVLLERVVEELDLTGRVTFTGVQSPSEVCQWMQQAKLFVLPSIEEGLGVVLLEALACGTPIVASCVGGIPDVVTAEVGVLVPPANSDLLAEAISQLLSDDQRLREMSIKARERAEKIYDWQKIATRFITIYRDMLMSRRKNVLSEEDTGQPKKN